MKERPYGDYLSKERKKRPPEEPKAEVEIHVKYLGKEYDIDGELDVSYGFWDALGDMVAALDYDIREAREKRLNLKATLKQVV